MEIAIDSSVFALFPEMSIDVLVVRGLRPNSNFAAPPNWPVVDAYQSESLITAWRALFKQFPSDKKARCSIEYLCKAVQKGNLRQISPIVDLYNYASLLALSPFGGEDLQSLQGQLRLSCAGGNEVFLPLSKTEVQTALIGELIWQDGIARVVCRALNWLESDIHKLGADTSDIVFVSERPSTDFPAPKIGMDFLQKNLAPHCAEIQHWRLHQRLAKVQI